MDFIIPLIYLLFSTGTLVVLLKEKFGKCLPLSMIISTLLIFFSQLFFHTFLIGYILCILFSLIFPLILIIKKVKNEDLTLIKNNYLSYGLIVFLVLYVILYIINIGKLFNLSDEFHFWGYNVKYMLKNDSYIMNGSHLPFISTFEMFMCILRNGYSEEVVTFAIQLFEFSFIIPCISDYNFKDKKYNTILKTILGIIFTMLLVFMFDFAHTSSNIYTDAFMMLYLAYLIFMVNVYDFSKVNTMIIFAISVYGFILNKQIVLVLLLIPFFNLLLKNILDNKNIKNKLNKNNITYLIKSILLYIIVPFIIIMLWNGYISSSNNSTSSSVSFVTNFVNIISGKTSATYEFTALENFLKAITNRIIFESTTLSLTYLSLFCIIILCMYLLFKYNKKYNKNMYISMLLTYIVGAIGYSLIFLIMYSFGGFNEEEGLKLASYERYMSTFLMGLILCLFMIYMYISSNKKVITYKSLLLSLCVMFIFLPGDKYYCLLPAVLRNSSSEKALNLKEKEISLSINENINDETSNIIVMGNDIEVSIYIKYYAEKFNYNFYSYTYDYTPLTYEEFLSYLSDYDYFVIFDNNDTVTSYLEKITTDEITEKSIYKINKENLTLTKIN